MTRVIAKKSLRQVFWFHTHVLSIRYHLFIINLFCQMVVLNVYMRVFYCTIEACPPLMLAPFSPNHLHQLCFFSSCQVFFSLPCSCYGKSLKNSTLVRRPKTFFVGRATQHSKSFAIVWCSCTLLCVLTLQNQKPEAFAGHKLSILPRSFIKL